MRDFTPDESDSAILADPPEPRLFPVTNEHEGRFDPDSDDCPNIKQAGYCYQCCLDCNLELHKCIDCGEILNHFYKNVDDTPHEC